MGMFDKDKEVGRQLTSEFKEGEKFILYAVDVDPEAVKTDLGMADKTSMEVARLNDRGERFEVNSLGSAIASKAKEADDSDFPAIVCWLVVDSKKWGTKATVLQFIEAA